MAPGNNMPVREVAYIARTPEVTARRIAEVIGAEGIPKRRMLLVGTTGPTSFVIKEAAQEEEASPTSAPEQAEGSEVIVNEESSATPPPVAPVEERKHRVLIGSRHRCSCGETQHLCVHALFVLIKVLRVPAENPLVWQLSLVDAELDTVLNFRARQQSQRKQQHNFLRRKTGAGGGFVRSIIKDEESEEPAKEDDDLAPGPETVGRPELPEGEDDVCPVCLDTVDPTLNDEPLTYCAASCANWVHVRCMIEYAEHADVTVKCPLCREGWGGSEVLHSLRRRLEKEKAKPRAGRPGSDVHLGTHCSSCAKRPITGDRYRCLHCSFKKGNKLELCEACFGRGCHGHHPFVVKRLVGENWSPAPRLKPAPRARSRAPSGDVVSLQFRDINPEDYASLLGLDGQRGGVVETRALPTFTSLGAYLVSTLGRNCSKEALCAECSLDKTSCMYPCGHSAHERCAIAAFDDESREASQRFTCGNCAQPTHPGLIVKRKEQASGQQPESEPQQSFSLAVVGASTSQPQQVTAAPARRRERPAAAAAAATAAAAAAAAARVRQESDFAGLTIAPAFSNETHVAPRGELARGAVSRRQRVVVEEGNVVQERRKERQQQTASSTAFSNEAAHVAPRGELARGAVSRRQRVIVEEEDNDARRSKQTAALAEESRTVAEEQTRRHDAAERLRASMRGHAAESRRNARTTKADAAAARRAALLKGSELSHLLQEGQVRQTTSVDSVRDRNVEMSRQRAGLRNARLRNAEQRRAELACAFDTNSDNLESVLTMMRSNTAPLNVQAAGNNEIGENLTVAQPRRSSSVVVRHRRPCRGTTILGGGLRSASLISEEGGGF